MEKRKRRRIKALGIGLGVTLLAAPFLLSMMVPAGIAGAAATAEAEAAAVETTAEGGAASVASKTTGGLVRVEGGGGAAMQAAREEGLSPGNTGLKRSRDEIVPKLLKEQHPPERIRLLTDMPEELSKLHGELRKIAPGHFETVPLRYMTEEERTSMAALYPDRPVGLGFYDIAQKSIVINSDPWQFTTRDIVYHEATHTLQFDLGTHTVGVDHNALFKETHEVVWARAYGHSLLTRQELDTSLIRVNSVLQRNVDLLKLPDSSAAQDLFEYQQNRQDRLNHLIDMERFRVRSKSELREIPFPTGGGGLARGGGGEATLTEKDWEWAAEQFSL